MGTLTSSSSGHSSNDDRWYDIIEVSDSQENGHAAEFVAPQKQSAPYQHSKVAHTSSLPLTNAINRPLSIHHQELSGNVKQLNDIRAGLTRTSNSDYFLTKAPKIQEYLGNESMTKSLHIPSPASDGNQTDTSSVNLEPLYAVSTKCLQNMTIHDDESNGMSINDGGPLRRSSTTSSVYKNSKTGECIKKLQKMS